jgi:alkyldihydroxyacetonephosphate synthase
MGEMLLREVMLYQELVGAVGERWVSREEAERTSYAKDYSWLGRTWVRKGWKVPLPDYVVWPGSTEEVARVLRIANRYKVPVVPYCGGAGVQGGTLPIYGGIILDVKCMDRVLEIDEANGTVTAQAGIIGQNLEWALNQRGLTLAHIPQSAYCSGLGGFLATRSAGVLSTRYGKITDMVLGMEVVLPQGEVVRFRSVPESAAGPDLKRLFLGSEGTLGVITEATLAVHPLPECRRFRGVAFPDTATGLEAARQIMRRGLRPAAMRLSDELESLFLYKRAGALMVWCFDGFAAQVEAEEGEALRLALALGGEDLGPEPGEDWWEHRYTSAYPTAENLLLKSEEGWTIGTVIDTAGTFDYLRAVHGKMSQALSRYEGLLFAAHFSHWYPTGGMMYPYVLCMGAPDDERAADLYFRIQRDALRVILDLGGTINHHHGVGLTLGEFMAEEFGAAFATLQAIKRLLDPHNIMNPGKLGFEGREA